LTILRRGRIRTLDASLPSVEALAIQEGRVVLAGAEDAVMALADAGTQVVDLDGRTVLPGLTDAHLHLRQYAVSFERIDCETPSMAECLARVREHAETTPPGEWILGHGWNQNVWGGYGDATSLEAAAPDHPVYLTSKSLHAAWANTRALRLAGIAPSTPDPDGGVIQRDSRRQPTGILLEKACGLVSNLIPAPSTQRLAQSLRAAQPRLLRLGLTGVHDFDDRDCHQALEALRRQGELGLRVVKNIRREDLAWALESGMRTGQGDVSLRIGNLKVLADGALGPRTAAMLAPYEGEPDNYGMLLVDPEELFEVGAAAAAHGLALAVHAIGDWANRVVLHVLQRCREYEAERGLPLLRHRIEHLQLLHPDDVARPARLGVVASMQPIHATSDRVMADRHWGTRVRHAYAWRSLLGAGAALAFGSDAPVESANPFLGIHAAVTRRDRNGLPGPEGWVPEERLSVEEAVRAYSIGPAYAAGLEAALGKLSAGYLADLIVLDEDPFTCPAEALAEIAPVGTMVGGRWGHRAF
jgi:predicted amidohydrolase YtcJ